MGKNTLIEMIGNTTDPIVRDYIQYHEDTIAYLEYINYPDYVTEIDPMKVAIFLAISIEVSHNANASFRRAALTIFSVTYQKMVEVHANEIRH